MAVYICGLKTVEKNVPVPLKSINVEVTIKGFIANVTSTLHYKNTENEAIEAVYEFPMDDQSAVYHFEAKIQDRTIIAECQEKEQAKETYKEAVEQGYTATLLEEDDRCSDIFRCLIGNLPADTDAVIKIAYVTELSLQPGGVLKFELPTLLNPRYNPNVEAGGASVAPNIAYVPPTEAQPYTFSFKAVVASDGKISDIKSPKDELNVQYSDGNMSAAVSLAKSFIADHDLTLEIVCQEPFIPHVILAKGTEHKDGILQQDVLMLNFYPDLKESDYSSKHEFIFVIDRSGSMNGSRIAGAKETLLLFLKSLPSGCYFNIIGFGSRFELLFPEGSREYSEESLMLACKHQETIQADLGGTEILAPLQSIYNKPTMTTHSRQILLLTDGAVSNPAAVIDIVKRNSAYTRVFTFGIGTGASTSLVKGAARAGRGRAEFVKDNERMQPLVMKTLKAAMQSSVTDLHLDWQLGGSPSLVQVPQEMPPLFGGDRLIVYAIAKEKVALDGRVHLKGKIGERSLDYTLNVNGSQIVGSENDALPIHRLAAKAQIKQLQDGEKEKPDANKAAIILLSTAANIISNHTSMVGVDKERKERVVGNMVQRNVLVMSDPTLQYGRRGMLFGMAAPRMKAGGMAMPMMSCMDSSQRQMKGGPGMNASRYQSSGPLGMIQHSLRSACGPPPPPMGGKKRSLHSGLPDSDRDAGTCHDSDVYDAVNEEKRPDYMSVVSLQKFSGCWELNSSFAAVLGTTLDILLATATIQSPLDDKNVWATVLALAFLLEKFSAERDEWEMIDMKARQWLDLQPLEGHSVDTLIQNAKVVISKKI